MNHPVKREKDSAVKTGIVYNIHSNSDCIISIKEVHKYIYGSNWVSQIGIE